MKKVLRTVAGGKIIFYKQVGNFTFRVVEYDDPEHAEKVNRRNVKKGLKIKKTEEPKVEKVRLLSNEPGKLDLISLNKRNFPNLVKKNSWSKTDQFIQYLREWDKGFETPDLTHYGSKFLANIYKKVLKSNILGVEYISFTKHKEVMDNNNPTILPIFIELLWLKEVFEALANEPSHKESWIWKLKDSGIKGKFRLSAKSLMWITDAIIYTHLAMSKFVIDEFTSSFDHQLSILTHSFTAVAIYAVRCYLIEGSMTNFVNILGAFLTDISFLFDNNPPARPQTLRNFVVSLFENIGCEFGNYKKLNRVVMGPKFNSNKLWDDIKEVVHESNQRKDR